MKCKSCLAECREVVSFGSTPLANAFKAEQFADEMRYPLGLEQCERCSLVQLTFNVDKNTLFDSYAYATPQSEILSKHYDRIWAILAGHGFAHPPKVVEIGSNTGEFLLSAPMWITAKVGVEPAKNIAEIARRRGIRTYSMYWGDPDSSYQIVSTMGPPDIVVMRHCLAHVENLNDMVSEVAEVLDDDGIFVIENAYLYDTLERVQFDQIYHEHMSYFSAGPVSELLSRWDLKLIDVRFASEVHGGSVLFFATPAKSKRKPRDTVENVLAREAEHVASGTLAKFVENAERSIKRIHDFVSGLVSDGKIVDVYGASAKGSTLLNICNLNYTSIRFAEDSSLLKQGKYMPGSKVPIISREEWSQVGLPDYALLTAWNYAEEICQLEKDYLDGGGKFVIPVGTQLTVIENDGKVTLV